MSASPPAHWSAIRGAETWTAGPDVVFGPAEGRARDTDLPIPDFCCDCCDLPLCFEKQRGIGYLCRLCVSHFDVEAHPRAPTDEIRAAVAEREAAHAMMAAVWVALTEPADATIREALQEAIR